MDKYPIRHENAEAFDRQACIRGFFADERPIMMLSLTLDQKLEARYLADELVGSGEALKTHLQSMATTTEDIRQRLLDTGELTEDDISRYGDAAYEASLTSFGKSVLDFAQQAEIAHTLSPKETARLMTFDWLHDPEQMGTRLAESAKHGKDEFDQKGWAVFPTTDGPMLISLAETTPDTDATFNVAHLDQVYLTNPEFLKGLIREHHKIQAGRAVVETARYLPRLHELVTLSDVLPQYMVELGGIEDAQQRQLETQAILDFLNQQLPALETRRQLEDFCAKFTSKMVSFEDKRFVHTESYLNHVSKCPSQPQGRQVVMADLLKTHEQIRQLPKLAPPLTPAQPHPSYNPVLAAPYTIMKSPYEPEGQWSKAFKAQTGITDADVDILAQISQRDASHWDPGYREDLRIRHNVFTPLFNALVLHTQGVIDMTRPSFTAFLKDFTGEENLDVSPLLAYLGTAK